MKRLDSKRNRIILTALILFVTVIVSAVISFSTEIELEYTKSLVEQLYDELLVRDDRLINSDVYLVTDGYISRIKPNTSVEEFKDNFNRNDFVILEGGKEVSEGIIKSGMEVVRDDEHYNLVVAGDLNKDGLMNYVDTSIMINNTKSLTDDELVRKANDFNEDSKYDKTDVLNSVDYILDDKIELKEISKVKTPVIEFVSGVEGARDWFLNDIKLKFNATEDLEIGYKIIGSVDEVGIVDDGYEVTLSGYGAYKVIAWHIGKEGNRSDTTSLVYKIDDREIEASITYSSTEIGSERVIAAISFNKENVFITNNDGRYTHTFYGNDVFDFEYEDLTGRTGRAHAEVSWVTDAIGEDGQWRYSVLNDEEIYLREYLAEITDDMEFVVPAEYDGYKVYGVGNNIDYTNIFGDTDYCGEDGSCVFVKKIIFEEGIVELGEYSFNSTGQSDKVLEFSDSIKIIGDYAFANEGYNYLRYSGSLSLGENLMEIGGHAFSNNEFSQIVFNDKLEFIGDYAFSRNSLTGDLIIPNSVITIGGDAFNENGISGELVLGNKLTTIGPAAFGNGNFIGDLIIPDSVKTIGVAAFENSGFSGSLSIGSGLEKISPWTFYGTNFVGDLIIPDGITEVGKLAFSNNAFDGDLIIGDGITDLSFIESSSLELSSFKGDLVIGDGITEIPAYFFSGMNFDGTLTLGNSIRTIGPQAFYNNSFTGDLVIPNSVTRIGVSAFSDSGFNGKLILGNGLTSIEEYTFYLNSFSGELTIPESVKEIYSNAFALNSSLTGTVDASLFEFIDPYAFDMTEVTVINDD